MRFAACCSGRWKCGASRGESRDELDDLLSAVHRLQRTDSEEHVLGPVRERAQQTGQQVPSAKVTSVRPEVDAGQDDLLVAGGNRAHRRGTRTSFSGCDRPAPRVCGMMQ